MPTPLTTSHPKLAAQWHPTLNSTLTPEAVSLGSSKKVWWLGECGHEWQALITNRVRGASCPYCSGKKVLAGYNDFATTYPDVAAQWHPTKNGELTPLMFSAGSDKKVWWLGDCSHEWQAVIKNRTLQDQKCSVCSGQQILVGFNDLATTHPELASEWHPTLNKTLTPSSFRAGSHEKVWWLGDCGHEWDMIIRNRSQRGHGCPYCSGQRVLSGFNSLSAIRPEVAAQWHPTLNGDLTPQQVTIGSSCKKIWWQCDKGHEWTALVSGRTRTDGKAYGCPTCAAQSFISRGEQGIADYLTNELGLSIEQSNRSLLKGTELDIYVPDKKLAIEYNGLYWHSSAVQSDPKHHQKKYELARAAGIQLLQIWEDEWRDKTELVKRLLAHKLGESRESLVGGRQTLVEDISLPEARDFLDEYHIQGHTNGSYYLGLRSKKDNQLVALMVLVKRANPAGLTLEIVRYATSCRVPGGFTKLLKHVETSLQPSRLVTFADHCISDGGLYAQNGFTAEKELKPDYRYLVNNGRAHKFGYRLARFKSDPKLLWEPNLTETKLAQLNGLHRIFDAGKTRWTKNFQ